MVKRAVASATFVGIMLVPAVSSAQTTEEISLWQAEWAARGMEHGFSVSLIIEYMEYMEGVSHIVEPKYSHPVDKWRGLVERFFQPEDVDMALRIMDCESEGDPNAKNPISTASGLFQHVRGWWSGAWGYPAFDPFTPEESVRAAAYLRYKNGGWSDWRPSQHCWGN